MLVMETIRTVPYIFETVDKRTGDTNFVNLRLSYRDTYEYGGRIETISRPLTTPKGSEMFDSTGTFVVEEDSREVTTFSGKEVLDKMLELENSHWWTKDIEVKFTATRTDTGVNVTVTSCAATEGCCEIFSRFCSGRHWASSITT